MFGNVRTNQNTDKQLQCAIYTRKSHVDGLEVLSHFSTWLCWSMRSAENHDSGRSRSL